MLNFLENTKDFILDNNLYVILIYLIIAYFSMKIINKIIIKALSIKTSKFNIDDRKEKTLGSIITNIVSYFIWFSVAIAILDVLGFNISTLIAGAGILGIGLSFGAQSLFKDFISGFFIIFEDHFNIGDVIEVSGFKGEVVSLGLKTTRIRNWKGEEKIVANGDIDNLTNYSINDSMAVIDVGVAYESDLKKVEKILLNYIEKESIEEINGEIKLLGVQRLDDSAVVFRIIAPTIPMEHFSVERQMRMNIKNLLDKKGISIPFPQVTINKK